MKLWTKVFFTLFILTGCAEEKKEDMLEPLMQKSQKKSYVIASPLIGVLKNNGEPLSEVKIKRKLTWNDNQEGIFQEFATDKNGNFSLPLHEEAFSMSSLVEFVAQQKVWVIHEGEEVLIWLSSNRNGKLYGETADIDIGTVNCELTDEFARVFGENQSLLGTKCRWDSINLQE